MFVLVVFVLVLLIVCGMIFIEFVFIFCWLEFDIEFIDFVLLIEWDNGGVVVLFVCLVDVFGVMILRFFLRLVRSFFFKKIEDNKKIYFKWFIWSWI